MPKLQHRKHKTHRGGRSVAMAKFRTTEFERLDGVCPFCKVEMTKKQNHPNSVTFDHVVSIKNGGADDVSNGQVMCQRCNKRKGSHSLEIFVKHRVWELPDRNYHLFNSQRHSSVTGDAAAMNAMIKVCLAKNL